MNPLLGYQNMNHSAKLASRLQETAERSSLPSRSKLFLEAPSLPLNSVQAIKFQGVGANEMPDLVLSRQEGPVRYLSMNRTAHQNRLSPGMFQAMSKAFTAAENDPNTKTIVLESGIDGYFSPGADLGPLFKEVKEIHDDLEKRLSFLPKKVRKLAIAGAQFKHIRDLCIDGHLFVTQVARSKKPTVAVVEGMAIGGGVELALAADYIVASHDAKFAVPEVKYGIFPDWGAAERLPQRVGPAMSKFIILEGGLMGDRKMEGPATLTAEEAERIGMIDIVVEAPHIKEILEAGFQSGKFFKKAERPIERKDINALDAPVRKKLEASETQEESRLLAKFDRYQSATIDDLLKNELKDLYVPGVKLSLRRINDAPFVGGYRLALGSRLQHELDLVKLVIYSQAELHRQKGIKR